MEKKENFAEELEKQYNILIKASEKKEKKYFIIIISILTISMIAGLISCIFASSAYKNTKKINTEEKEKINTYYQTLAVTYNNGPKLELKGITNGYELENPKVITITNEGDTPVVYNIKITGIQTSLVSVNKLVYTISNGKDTSTAKELPMKDKSIITEVTIEPKQTNQYTIRARFTGQVAENDNSNYYNANVVVEQVNNSVEIIN